MGFRRELMGREKGNTSTVLVSIILLRGMYIST